MDYSATEQEDYHYRFKVVTLGDVKSGKSAFLDTLTQANGKVIEFESSEEISERVALHMYEHLLFKTTYWEVPGKDRQLKFLNHYCMGAAVAIVLFDTTKNSSFEKAEKIFQAIDVCEIPFKILVGNKIDLLNVKKNISNPVLQQDAEILAKNYNAEYFPSNSTQEITVNPIYSSYMNNIINLIGDNMELQYLIGKNISVGKRLLTHPNFIVNLKENSYFKN